MIGGDGRENWGRTIGEVCIWRLELGLVVILQMACVWAGFSLGRWQ